MSRIGILPVKVPEKVTVDISKDNVVTVKGALGALKQKVDPNITVKQEDDSIIVSRPSDIKRLKAMHGLYRSLIANMVQGVTEGFKVQHELVGVGFRAEAKGQILEMNLGYSHDIQILLPDDIKVEAKTERRSNPVVTLTSHDKQLLGQVSSKIRSLRPPEPYKGKGVKYVGENIRKKAGKAAK